jgi:hypothetical protein
MLYIETIFETMPYGKTKPVKVKANDGNVYVVKFRYDGVGRRDWSITNEYIAYRMVEMLGWNIAPVTLQLIEIDEIALELAEFAEIDAASLELMRQSIGVNIAVPFVDQCEKAVPTIDNLTFSQKVRTIDSIVMNDDRTHENPNILKELVHRKRYYAIDWGFAMDNMELYRDLYRGTFSDRAMYYHNAKVVQRPEYLFRALKGKAAFDLKRLESIIDEICASIPSMWETYAYRNEIAETLKIRMANEVIYG